MSFIYPKKSKSKFRMSDSTAKLFVYAVIFAVLFGGCAAWNASMGVHHFGPTNTYKHCLVTSKHIDHGKESSHYMVSTTEGTFEVDNGYLLGVWNADEIYGKIVEKKTYTIVAKGNKQVGMFYQEYPYLLSATEEKPNE